MTYSITKNGVELSKDLYTIDKKTKTFSSNESGLVLDFSDEHGWTFKTSNICIFNTGSNCTFDTGRDCTFDTGCNCAFNTGCDCTFKTGSNCMFNTECDCTLKTGSNCTFKTGASCVVVRRDVYEVIEIPADTTIKLHGYEIMGYDVIKKSECVKLEVEEIKKKIFDLIEELTKIEE